MLGIIFLLVAVVFLWIAFTKYKTVKSFIANGVETTAKVVVVHAIKSTSTDSEGYSTTVLMYAPELEYTDKEGNKHRYISEVTTSNKNAWHIGDIVPIIYDKDNADKAKIKKTLNLYMIPIVFAVLGVVFVVIGGMLVAMG